MPSKSTLQMIYFSTTKKNFTIACNTHVQKYSLSPPFKREKENSKFFMNSKIDLHT